MSQGVRPGHAYREEQRFRQWWLLLLLAVAAGAPVAIFAYGIIQQIVLGKPFGNNPVSDAALIGMAVPILLVVAAVVALIFAARLVIEVRDDGLHVAFWPLMRRRVPFDQIKSAEARTYSPIREYGGWGIRWNLRRGTAYNVSGKQGVQLKLADGRSILVGSRRPEELAKAIQERLRRHGRG